jgi:homoserine O-acetyltransferase/O-succinyltransferase
MKARCMCAALCLLSVAAGLSAQEQKFAELGDLRLESGETIRDCRLGYRTYGKLNRQKSNAILWPTWFSGRTADLAQFIGNGAGKMVDSSRYYVISVDSLGNGVSCSPSNSAQQGGAAFPRFTIRDMVNSQHLLLTKHLGISRLHAVMGISMGGMQTFQWMVSHPEFARKAVPIIGTPLLTSYDKLLWEAELKAIETAQACSTNPPADAGLPVVWAIHALALDTPAYRVRQTKAAEYEEFARKGQASMRERYNAYDWASQLRAMLAHDVTGNAGGSLPAAAERVKAQTLMVLAAQDHMVNPGPAQMFASRMGAPVLELTGECGHLATGCESQTLYAEVAAFLAQ